MGVSTVWKVGRIPVQLRMQPGNDSSKLWKKGKKNPILYKASDLSGDF